ncbi:MAG: hypothetical protein ACFFD2_24395 [Promethearchaeota archaeon]
MNKDEPFDVNKLINVIRKTGDTIEKEYIKDYNRIISELKEHNDTSRITKASGKNMEGVTLTPSDEKAISEEIQNYFEEKFINPLKDKVKTVIDLLKRLDTSVDSHLSAIYIKLIQGSKSYQENLRSYKENKDNRGHIYKKVCDKYEQSVNNLIRSVNRIKKLWSRDISRPLLEEYRSFFTKLIENKDSENLVNKAGEHYNPVEFTSEFLLNNITDISEEKFTQMFKFGIGTFHYLTKDENNILRRKWPWYCNKFKKKPWEVSWKEVYECEGDDQTSFEKIDMISVATLQNQEIIQEMVEKFSTAEKCREFKEKFNLKVKEMIDHQVKEMTNEDTIQHLRNEIKSFQIEMNRYLTVINELIST